MKEYCWGKYSLLTSNYWMCFICFREEEEKAVHKTNVVPRFVFAEMWWTVLFQDVLAKSSTKHNKIWSCCYIRICLKTLTISYCSAFCFHYFKLWLLKIIYFYFSLACFGKKHANFEMSISSMQGKGKIRSMTVCSVHFNFLIEYQLYA